MMRIEIRKVPELALSVDEDSPAKTLDYEFATEAREVFSSLLSCPA
jgi:hypothetical protein